MPGKSGSTFISDVFCFLFDELKRWFALPSIHKAAVRGNLSKIEHLVKKGVRVDIQDREGHTPLHVAIPFHQTESMKLLISFGASLSCQDQFGQTPLHHAASLIDDDTVELLLKAGADPNARDCFGNTPLHAACEMVSFWTEARLLQLLEAGASPDILNDAGQSPRDLLALAKPNQQNAKLDEILRTWHERRSAQ